MSPRFKANNFFAILIAIILVVIGFALAFIHKQTESAREQTSTLHALPAFDAILDQPLQRSGVYKRDQGHHAV